MSRERAAQSAAQPLPEGALSSAFGDAAMPGQQRDRLLMELNQIAERRLCCIGLWRTSALTVTGPVARFALGAQVLELHGIQLAQHSSRPPDHAFFTRLERQSAVFAAAAAEGGRIILPIEVPGKRTLELSAAAAFLASGGVAENRKSSS